MSYVSWAIFCEGRSDGLYLEVMVARLMEDIVAREGIRTVDIPQVPAIRLGSRGRGVGEVAVEACESRQAFELVFIHGDTGGRALEAKVAARSENYCDRMSHLCAWPPERCLAITPRHETEAWILADPLAVLSALGYRGRSSDIGLRSRGRTHRRPESRPRAGHGPSLRPAASRTRCRGAFPRYRIAAELPHTASLAVVPGISSAPPTRPRKPWVRSRSEFARRQ